MSKRIGVVTGGGDCPGLNAVIRAVAKASANRGWECIGVLGGYEGLLEPRRTIPLDYQILSGLNHAYAFSGSFSAAGRRPHLIARLVQSSAQQRWN
jgi:6-phosphofructokinase